MSNATDSKQTMNKTFPDVERLRNIMKTREVESKKLSDQKKEKFEENFKRASEVYYEALLSNIYDALNYMENSIKSGSTLVYVNVPNDRIKWGDEDEKYIPWHWIHYGFPNKGSKQWTDRDLKSWAGKEDNMVFRRLQKLCYDNGYYFYDFSNPDKGTKTFLKISVNRMIESEEPKLWHGFNTFIFDAE